MHLVRRLHLGRSTVLPFLTTLVLGATVTAEPAFQHDLRVRLEPLDGEIRVEDRIRRLRPVDGEETFTFTLDTAMEAVRVDPPARLVAEEPHANGSAALRRHTVIVPEDEGAVTVRYRGRIMQRPSGRGGSEWLDSPFAAGHIGPQGVFLTRASGWVPWIDGHLPGFSMEVDLPAGWTAVSQGEGTRLAAEEGRSATRWVERQPQDDIVLFANRFHVYAGHGKHARAFAYLLEPEPELAERYLEATDQYVDLYSRLIGPYAYAKFALVENFWETGYGMPSLTLLGPRVVRLPFIIHSSYPHEILHNWWGNGVFVDYAGGNWSEGLTAYLADHLIQEQRGRGVDFRRSALQKYRNYVDGEKDFALEAFRSKHGDASEAVGYNKTLMFFHMLRRKLGDEVFVDALRRFYAEQRFRFAGYAELRAAFEAASGLDLQQEFHQWVARVGAPALRLDEVRVEETSGGYRLTARLEQVQEGAAYQLRVPVAVQLEGAAEARRDALAMSGRSLKITLDLSGRPVHFAVDPEFDLFRVIDMTESPPSLGELFGSDDPLFVLPAAAPVTLLDAYRALARRLGATEVVMDIELEVLPSKRAVWLLGWENRHRVALRENASAADLAFDSTGVRIVGKLQPRAEQCSVLAVRRSEGNGDALAWIGCDDPEAFAGLARKLPHYGKYGYLSFTGGEPRNVLKGQWQMRESPLSVPLDLGRHPLRLARRPSLVDVLDASRR